MTKIRNFLIDYYNNNRILLTIFMYVMVTVLISMIMVGIIIYYKK